MASNTTWTVSHILCIASHIIMLILAFAAFAAAGIGSFNENSSSGKTIPTVVMPWALFGLAMVSIGLSSYYYIRLRRLRSGSHQDMNDDELFTNRSTNYIIAIFIGCCVFGADTGLSAYAATFISEEAVVAAPASMGFISGFLSLFTVINDYKALRFVQKEEAQAKESLPGLNLESFEGS